DDLQERLELRAERGLEAVHEEPEQLSGGDEQATVHRPGHVAPPGGAVRIRGTYSRSWIPLRFISRTASIVSEPDQSRVGPGQRGRQRAGEDDLGQLRHGDE